MRDYSPIHDEVNNFDNSSEIPDEKIIIDPKENTLVSEFGISPIIATKVPRQKITKPANQRAPSELQDMNEINEKINQFLEECSDGSFKCTYCNKGSNPIRNKAQQRQNIQQHIETHLDGLSYRCPICQTVTRSSSALRMHRRRNHTEMQISFNV